MPVDGVVRMPDAPLRIRINAPSPERAAELVRRRPAPDEPDALAEASQTPPLLDPASASVPVGHLSYSALALYERCGYRFYLERVLGAREALASPASADAEAHDADDDTEPGAVRGVALGVGNTVHAALEWSARNGWERPAESLIRSLLAR